MKHISILVPQNAVMQAIADPQYLFTTANKFLEAAGQQPVFTVELVGTRKIVGIPGNYFSVTPDRLITENFKTDLVIIPAVFGDMKNAIAENKELLPWIKEQYANGAEVASLCVGAFLLASTGLLDNKKCSTHWAYQNEFAQMFPDTEVVEGNIVTEQDGIYSSGGANSYWNLLLRLVEKYTDRHIAILAAKYFAIDIDRDSQSSFAIFQGQKNHDDIEVKTSQEFIESNFDQKITIDGLASSVAIGRRTFERRFKKATSNTVIEYLQRVKIEAAKRHFENSRSNISEVMYDVGYTDTKAFRDIFKRITGLTPIEYRNKYSKIAV